MARHPARAHRRSAAIPRSRGHPARRLQPSDSLGGGSSVRGRLWSRVIAPDTIAAVKDRADIVAVIGETVRLKRQGRRWVGLCPFHKEKSPSFSVNQERGFFHCFGCKESGTAIDFVMKLEGCTFPEAVKSLAERCGI